MKKIEFTSLVIAFCLLIIMIDSKFVESDLKYGRVINKKYVEDENKYCIFINYGEVGSISILEVTIEEYSKIELEDDIRYRIDRGYFSNYHWRCEIIN